jgi:hypothetical protein
MPITGERILEVSSKKDKMEGYTHLNVDISIMDVKVEGGDVELRYQYTANYEDKIGYITIKGILFAKEERKLAEQIKNEWDRNHRLPEVYADGILTTINYSGSVNGTLVARVLGLAAPYLPQKIQMPKKSDKK